MAYVPPFRNPLRRLPIRQYQGPLRNRLPGLGDCPGDPGCPGNPTPAPDIFNLPLTGPYTNPSPVTSAQLGIAASAQNPNLPGPSVTQTFTTWLNANSSTALWVGGIALAVLMLSRVAR